MMNHMKRYIQIALCFAIFFAAGTSLNALENLEWIARGGMLFLPEENGLESDPSPLLGTPGTAARYSFFDFLALEASLDFYMTHFAYSNILNRAVPAAIENRSALVIGSVLGIQAVFMVNPLDTWMIRAYFGPTIDARLSLIAGGLNDADKEDAASQTKAVSSYFWNLGRWFYPAAGLGMDFTIADDVLQIGRAHV
jgi:hypothetical protein